MQNVPLTVVLTMQKCQYTQQYIADSTDV